jgi:hypothetical protein
MAAIITLPSFVDQLAQLVERRPADMRIFHCLHLRADHRIEHPRGDEKAVSSLITRKLAP